MESESIIQRMLQRDRQLTEIGEELQRILHRVHEIEHIKSRLLAEIKEDEEELRRG